MIWDGTTAIEPKIGENVEYGKLKMVCRKGGGMSHSALCKSCALFAHRSLCGLVNCVGTNRADEMKVYMEKVEEV